MPIKGLKGGIGTKALGYGLGGAVEATDPEFNQTVLLLHGDGTEGAGDTSALGDPNYKAFIDNSTSAHNFVVSGDAYGNDFSPYYYADGYWSIESNTSSMVEIDGSSFPALGTDDFTIEAWVYFNDGASNTWYDTRPSGVQGAYPSVRVGTNAFRYYVNSADQITGDAKSPNTWYHVAIVRSSGSTKLYVNGTQEGSTYSDSNNYLSATDRPRLGNRNGTGFNGYLSNLRVVKGTAIYTSNFTAPTAPLTAVTNTELLICQSNRFLDNSSSSHSLSITGTPKVSTNTPFTVTKTANVGSGFFDGDDSILASAGATLALGSGDFTLECWAYCTSANDDAIYDGRTSNLAATGLTLTGYSSTVIRTFNSAVRLSGTVPNYLNQWTHIAVTRSGSTTRLFVNGKQVDTETDSQNYSDESCSIGARHYGGVPNYTADFRIVKGTAVYTSDFTPPTSSLSAITNTNVLICQYSGAVRNVGFDDESKYNHRLVRSGDVHLGTFSPYSLEDRYWSTYFKGSGAYQTFPNSSAFAFGTGAFTIEFWFNGPLNDDTFILSGRAAIGTLHITFGGYGGSTAGSLRYVGSSTITTGTDLISDNSWHHVAIERDGSNNVVLYIDGVSKGTGTDTTNYTTTSGTWYFPCNDSGQGNQPTGYFSNLRIVKGSNVYGGAFSPPSSPLTAVTNTQLLIQQSNRFVDNSTNAIAITTSGDPRIQPFSPFTPTRSYSKNAVGGSMYVDGNGDYIYAEGNGFKPFKILSSSEFSIEFWYYRLVAGSVDIVISGDSLDEFQIGIDASNDFDVFMFGSRLVSSPTFPLASNPHYTNQWHHFVMTRESHDTKIRTFINGELVSITAANTGDSDFDDLVIGHQGKGTNHPSNGYIAGVKFSNSGVPSAYQTTETSTGTQVFTPPTAPVTADTDTQLLTNFTNAGIIDHTMKNNLETEGGVKISTIQKKFGTGSIFFPSSPSAGDQIEIPYQPYHQLGTGPFTVEFFVYLTSTDGTQGFLGNDSAGWYFQIYAGELEFAQGSSAVIERAWSHSINQWYHLAVTRDSSNDIRIFVDGTQQGAVVNSTTDFNHASNGLQIGGIGPTFNRFFQGGYMDEIRIIKGAAKYTANFTSPTEAFANR